MTYKSLPHRSVRNAAKERPAKTANSKARRAMGPMPQSNRCREQLHSECVTPCGCPCHVRKP